MKITLPNGIVIEDADANTIASLLAASFTTKPAHAPVHRDCATPESTAPADDDQSGKKMHPLNANRKPSENYDALPGICQRIGGSHHKAKKELFLVLSELNRAARPLAPRELVSRLKRFEVFARLSAAHIVNHSLFMLIQYGAVVKRGPASYAIGPEIIGSSDEDLVALIELHDTADEWAKIKR